MFLVPQLAFLDVGTQEMAVILIVALLIFGGRLPEVARNLGRTVGELKRSAENLTREFRQDLQAPPPKNFDAPQPVQKWRGVSREEEEDINDSHIPNLPLDPDEQERSRPGSDDVTDPQEDAPDSGERCPPDVPEAPSKS